MHVQRSCGYSMRPTLSIADIRTMVSTAKAISPDIVVIVDNCYGEFTEAEEPGAVGADVVVGSLIKSPGGTLATGAPHCTSIHDTVSTSARRAPCTFGMMFAGRMQLFISAFCCLPSAEAQTHILHSRRLS